MTFHTIRQFGSVARLRVAGSVGTAPSSGDAYLYYECEDNAASATVVDAVGNNNGSASPNTEDITATGKIDNGFDLDGTNDYIDIGKVFGAKLDADFSVTGWFNTDVTGTFMELVSFRGERNCEIRIETDNTLNFKIFSNPTEYKVTTTTTISSGTWYFFAVTRSKTNGMKIYLGATEEDSDAFTGNASLSSLTRNAIGELGNGSFYFNGQVDELCFFEAELTADNVTYLHQNGNPGSAQQYPFT